MQDQDLIAIISNELTSRADALAEKDSQINTLTQERDAERARAETAEAALSQCQQNAGGGGDNSALLNENAQLRSTIDGLNQEINNLRSTCNPNVNTNLANENAQLISENEQLRFTIDGLRQDIVNLNARIDAAQGQ